MEREHMRTAFRAFAGSSSALTVHTLPLAMTAVLGYRPSRVDVAMALGLAEVGGTEAEVVARAEGAGASVDEAAFVAYMVRKTGRAPPEAHAVDAYEALASVTGSAFLTRPGLDAALAELGAHSLLEVVAAASGVATVVHDDACGLNSLDSVFAEGDLDGDGRISRADFLLLASRAADAAA